MTPEEMITAISVGNTSDELINALVQLEWDYNAYEVIDNYGHIDDDGVREMLEEDVRAALNNSPLDVIEYIKEMVE